MEARRLVVDHVEPGGLARQAATRIHRRFGHFQRRDRGGAEILGLAARGGAFGDLEQARFRLGDLLHRRDLVRRVERAFDEVAPHADQFAQQREIVDLPCQFARGEQALAIGGQLGEIDRPAQRLQRLVLFEIGFQRHRSGDRVALDQFQHAFVDALVDGFVEMARTDRGLQFLDHLIVDQDRAEKRGFGFEIRRQSAGLLPFRGCGLVRIGGAQEDRGIGHPAIMREVAAGRKGAFRGLPNSPVG